MRAAELSTAQGDGRRDLGSTRAQASWVQAVVAGCGQRGHRGCAFPALHRLGVGETAQHLLQGRWLSKAPAFPSMPTLQPCELL